MSSIEDDLFILRTQQKPLLKSHKFVLKVSYDMYMDFSTKNSNKLE